MIVFSRLVLFALLLSTLLSASPLFLDYQGRYNCQNGTPDHLMDVLSFGGHYAIVSGNQGLAVVDVDALPVNGTSSYLSRLTGLNSRDVVTEDEVHFYVNLQRQGNNDFAGLAVLRRNGVSLQHLLTLDESGVIYEKMCLAGGFLYVTAHSHGLRIFDIANPANPVLVGSLDSGFVDAFSVSVEGSTAYVADGAGGLKVLDVSDPGNPTHIGGQDLASAEGTAEAVLAHEGHVYLAAGSAGLIFFENGEPEQPVYYPVSSCAEDLSIANGLLALSDLSGNRIYEILPGGSLEEKRVETAHRRGYNAKLRLAGGLDLREDGTLLCGNWNYMDVYQVLPEGSSSQADINASTQRIRFAPEGGSHEVSISNGGSATLIVNSIASSSPAFSCSWSGGSLAPGESVNFLIHHSGGAPHSGVMRFFSNDPDESPLPIQVFGSTVNLDPGEEAIDFTLPSLSRGDPGDWQTEDFTLSDHLGKVVWFQVYGSW